MVIVVLLRRGAKGGFVSYCTIGEFSKGSTLNDGSGSGEGCGQKGESSDGVFHFDIMFSFFFPFLSRLEVLWYVCMVFNFKKQRSSVQYGL